MSMLTAKLRSLCAFDGSRYHAGGSNNRGCRPGVPGSSSSPAGSSRKLASSFTDSRSGKCHGTWALLSLSGFSASSWMRTPADSRTLRAEIRARRREAARSSDTPMRTVASNPCCSAFSRIVFRASAVALLTEPRITSSQVACGSERSAGTGEGAKPLPSTTWRTVSVPRLSSVIATSPARIADCARLVLSDSTGLVILSSRAARTVVRLLPYTSRNWMSPWARNA